MNIVKLLSHLEVDVLRRRKKEAARVHRAKEIFASGGKPTVKLNARSATPTVIRKNYHKVI